MLDEESCKLINSNLINLILMNSQKDCVMYLQSSASLFVFTKKAFSQNLSFFKDYFLKTTGFNEFYKFRIMDTDCELYREHQKLLSNRNILMVKYANHGEMVYKSLISKKNNDIFLEGCYLGTEKHEICNGLKFKGAKKRKILPGITVQDYIETLSIEQQKTFLKKFFDWLFSEYVSEKDPNKMRGVLIDGHFNNFIISQGEFILVDKDIECADIDKNIYMWYTLWNGTHPLYNYFLDLYGLEAPKGDVSYPLFIKDAAKEILHQLNKDLLDRYFTEKCLIPKTCGLGMDTKQVSFNQKLNKCFKTLQKPFLMKIR